jgi:DNA-binding NarL/FixJ family response regulator
MRAMTPETRKAGRTEDGPAMGISPPLGDIATTLKVLLDQRDADTRKIEAEIVRNMKHLVLPYLENLMSTPLTPRQKMPVRTIKANPDEIVSPFLKEMYRICPRLTSTEIRVAGFIKDGRTSKEIANIPGASESAVNLHRQHVRQKLGLKHAKTNLRAYLPSLADGRFVFERTMIEPSVREGE